MWLVTGGAGYVGAHVIRALQSAGFGVVAVDSLTTGRSDRIPEGVPFIKLDCREASKLKMILEDYEISGVVHLAALKHARESRRIPSTYWINNVGSTLGVLEAAKGTNVDKFVLSSSCSIFGSAGPVDSNSTPAPLSPYARTKLTSELLLGDVLPPMGISYAVLRYFNVIGNADFPHAHDTSSECLVPSSYRKAIRGRPVEVFGRDFDTPDGTALRDYVDVRDLAQVHALIAKRLTDAGSFMELKLNVGSGNPSSVLEILQALEVSLGRSIDIEFHAANPADPPSIWVNEDFANALLDWTPRYSVVDSIEAHVNSCSEFRIGP